jgi:anti-sigma regulatory factor (Ser/Thr protein kinase)
LIEARRHDEAPTFLAGAPDDILVLLLPLAPENGEQIARLPLIFERMRGDQQTEIDPLQDSWGRSLRFSLPELSDDRLTEILLCLREAMMNAMLHGCMGSAEKSCTLHVRIIDLPERKLLRINVDDPGDGYTFDWLQHEKDADKKLIEGHRGLTFLHHLSHRIERTKNGASIMMEFDLAPSGPRTTQP